MTLSRHAASPFIDGMFCDSESEESVDVINPSNRSNLFKVPVGHESDVDRAVVSSRLAFASPNWAELSVYTRKRLLNRFSDLIAANSARLDELDAGEMGKPVSVGFCNAAAASGLVKYHAEALDKLTGDVYSSDRCSLALQRRVPRGVVAAIVPWNFPTFCAILKLAPAPAAGNTVVLKPSEFSSRSALRLAELALEAELPAGVFNVVPGLGKSVGRALALHPDADMLAFTGSTAVGKLMLQYAGLSNMKIVQAECGGKSPQIVFDDGVDLNAAADSIAGALLTNQGQMCSVGSRVLVQRSIESEFVERISVRMRSIVMGDALDPAATFGPLVSAKQCARVMGYIEGAGDAGAKLVSGGRRALCESGGFFVEPTLFCDVCPRSRIATEEIFGPVLSVIPFDDEAEAIRIANGPMYGLIAYVWTANLSTGMRMSRGVRSSVIVNAALPAGEGAGLESYLRRQTILFNHG